MSGTRKKPAMCRKCRASFAAEDGFCKNCRPVVDINRHVSNGSVYSGAGTFGKAEWHTSEFGAMCNEFPISKRGRR